MTRPPSILTILFSTASLRDAKRRRIGFAVVSAILAILCVWPRHYLARADLAPDDSGGDLSSMLGSASGGGLLALGALLGTHQSIDEDLTIARSDVVRADVVRRLHLEARPGYGDFEQAEVKLKKQVDMETIRGSILQISITDKNAAFDNALITNYVAAIRDRLTTLNLQQAAQKKIVAENRLEDASTRLAAAQSELDRYRSGNRLAVPEVQLGAAVALVTSLQAHLDAEQAELRAAQQFATGENIQVRIAKARIAGLQEQIAQAQAQAKSGGAGPTVGAMTPTISEYENLYRNEKFSEAEYEIYKRYFDSVIVAELSASTTMDIIEPPHVIPERQFNINAVGGLILCIILAVLSEFYLARPPVGRR